MLVYSEKPHQFLQIPHQFDKKCDFYNSLLEINILDKIIF